MRLGTIESQCQKTFLVEVPVVTEHTVDDSCHGSTYLSVRQFLGQPSTPCQQSQWLEGTGAVGNGTPEYGEGPLGRDETFQNHAETLHALLGTLEIAIRRIPYLIFSTVRKDFQTLHIHGMEYEAVVIVKGKSRSVAIEAVTYIPLFHLAQSGDNTVSITLGTSLAQETFYRRREQQPVGIRRVHTAQLGELFNVTPFSQTIQRHPQSIVSSQEAFSNISGIDQRLSLFPPK